MRVQNELYMKRNSELSIEFSKYVLEHPEIDEPFNEGRIIIFIPEFDPELKEFNIEMGNNIEAEGGKVLYVKVKQLSPKITSRLIGVEVAVG